VSELGLGDAVRLLGFVRTMSFRRCTTPPTCSCWRRAATICSSEGFGIAIVERPQVGCPSSPARSGGIPEAVREGETGFLVDPDDPAAVARRPSACSATTGCADAWVPPDSGGGDPLQLDRVAADLIRIDQEFRRP